ncbi:MAG TPA: zinc-ribbon domain containing protein [Ktedonobacteraceae bacterium]|nr:zinc-ribbon domain containing protein [Ktedonobacteraceae bacterium]
MSDRTLYCRDCGQEFTFTTGEQEFYASRGLTNDPSRCPSCRAARKQAGGYQGRSGSRGGYRERESRPMYTAICASCGKEASVPFQPRDDRPVYCQDCYQQQASYRPGSGRSRW